MSKYRIDSNFKLMGAFWRYGQKDAKFTGILTSRKGLVEVKTAPSYLDLNQTTNPAALTDFNSVQPLQNIGSICGFTLDNNCTLLNAITLDGGGLTDFPSQQKISRDRFRAMRTVMGLHIESPDAREIDAAAYYFTKLHQLMPMPWKSEIKKETTTHTTSHQVTDVFAFSSEALDAKVECEVFAGGSIKFRKGIKILSVPRIKIVPKIAQSVDWYTSIAFRLENFFSLFMGTSVSLKNVQLFKSGDEGWVVQKVRRKREKVNQQTMIRCSFKETSNALERWLSIPIERQLVELNMLSIMRKSSIFTETEFLTLAQTLEGFGRIKFGGRQPREAKFKRLLENIYDMLSPDFAAKIVGDRSPFVLRVIQTRDHYTHIGNAKGTLVAKTIKDLFIINKRLQALLRCVVLLDLGISETYLTAPILYEATKWR